VEIPSDEATWALVLAAQPAAFGDIWDRHCDRILTYLLRLEGSRADAEDLTAVVFLELWRHRDTVRFVDGSMLPWLIVTAQNVHRNAARSRRRYRAMLATLPSPAPLMTTADAEMNDPRAEIARRIIASSRGTDRDLAILTVVEGFTVAEAAQAVGLTEPAARMRLSRLRSKIRSATSPAAALEGGAS